MAAYQMPVNGNRINALEIVAKANVPAAHNYASIVTEITGNDFTVVGFDVQIWIQGLNSTPDTYDQGYVHAQVWLAHRSGLV